MGFFTSFILIASAVWLLFVLYKIINQQANLFSKENLNKSFTTMGILALMLIGAIGLVVILLKQ